MSRWYYPASGFFLLQAMGAFAVVDYWIYGSWEGKTGDKLTQSFNLLQIAISLLLLARAYHRRSRIGTSAILAIVTAGFLLLSALWSVDSATSIRRGTIYVFFVIGAIGIAGNMDSDEFMGLLGLACLISAIGSLVVLVISPDLALMGDEFRGIFSHKNVFGEVMATGVLASLHGIRLGRKWLRHTVLLILFVALAVASKSATALMTIVAYCGVSGIAMLIYQGGVARIIAIFLTVMLLPIVVIAASFPDSLLEMMGKDPTLTGRTDLWSYVTGNIAQRPILGWGFAAFWTSDNIAAGEISTLLGWGVPEAHNGILEMMLEVGIVGTFLFLSLWVRHVYLAIQCCRAPARELGVSSLLCCGGIVLVGITEQVLVDPSFGSVSVFFIAGLMCEKAVRAGRRRRFLARANVPQTRSVRPQRVGMGAE